MFWLRNKIVSNQITYLHGVYTFKNDIRDNMSSNYGFASSLCYLKYNKVDNVYISSS